MRCKVKILIDIKKRGAINLKNSVNINQQNHKFPHDGMNYIEDEQYKELLGAEEQRDELLEVLKQIKIHGINDRTWNNMIDVIRKVESNTE